MYFSIIFDINYYTTCFQIFVGFYYQDQHVQFPDPGTTHSGRKLSESEAERRGKRTLAHEQRMDFAQTPSNVFRIQNAKQLFKYQRVLCRIYVKPEIAPFTQRRILRFSIFISLLQYLLRQQFTHYTRKITLLCIIIVR